MKLETKTMTLIGLFTALLCVAGPLSIPIPISPVPISLATLVIYIFSNLLGWKKGMICCFIYFLIGIAGLPVFSGFSAGISKLAGATGGYLIGYFFLAFFTGFFAEKFPFSKGFQLLGMVIGTLFLQCVGTMWLCIVTNSTFLESILVGVVPFLAGDICKMIVVVILAPIIKKQMEKANVVF